MKKTFFLLAAMSVSTLLFAQSLERQVIGISGGELSNDDVSLSTTAGEPVIGTISNGEQTLTQGFQQPDSKVDAPNPGTMDAFSMTTFPNPFVDQLTVVIKQDQEEQMFLTMRDISGREITSQSISMDGMPELRVNLSVKDLASGVYLITLTTTEGTVMKTHKVTRMQ